ncbi:hypothetical protein ACOSP7_001731 [Xanthoceras sorbifolium]
MTTVHLQNFIVESSRWFSWNNSCFCNISFGSCEDMPCNSGKTRRNIWVLAFFLDIAAVIVPAPLFEFNATQFHYILCSFPPISITIDCIVFFIFVICKNNRGNYK